MIRGQIVGMLVGLVVFPVLAGPAAVADDNLDQRVQQLESTVGCMSRVSPVAIAQLHHTTKRALVVTNEGADTFAHPSRYIWLVTMDPACAGDVSR